MLILWQWNMIGVSYRYQFLWQMKWGGWLISVLWVPHYYRPLPPEVVYQEHTPKCVQSLFPEAEKNLPLVVAADPKEITTNKTSDLQLQAILWSPKLKKFLSLKFGLFVVMDGRILYRSPPPWGKC
mmetsp:Transcript_2098/g.2829  ORF Transcript_2098/g.2829 Transcript_2098/m.2829 type:complete len:126 (+) Transcript_2098:369-746(+)